MKEIAVILLFYKLLQLKIHAFIFFKWARTIKVK